MPPALLWLAVVQVLTVLVAVLRAKVLAVVLGPGDFGISSTLDQVVLTLVSVGGLSVPFTGFRMMSRAHSDGPEAFGQVGSRVLRITLLLAVVTVLAAGLMLSVRPGLFGAELEPWALEQRLAVVGVISVFTTVFLMNVFASIGRHTAGAVSNLTITLVLASAATAGALAGGLRGLYLATAVAGVGASLVTLAVVTWGLGLRLRPAPASPQQPQQTASAGALVGQSACFYAIYVASAVAMLMARTRVLAQLGEAATGQLQAALSIAVTVGAVIATPSNLYLIPLVNRRAPTASKVEAADAFVGRMVILLALGAVPVALVPEPLLHLLYSAAFGPAATVLWLFVLWQCVHQVVTVYQQLLVGLDDVLYTAVAAVTAFALAVALMSAAVERLGLAGVAAALGAAMLLYLAALLARLRLKHRAAPSRRVGVRVTTVMGLVLAAGLAGRQPADATGLNLLAPAAVVALVALWVRFGLDPDERNPRAWLRMLPHPESADPDQRSQSAGAPT